MKIGIISDTHDNREMTLKAINIFKDEGAKTLFHLGDFVAPFTLKLFEGFNLYGVFGNNDGEKILLKKVAEDNDFVLEEAPLEINISNKNFILFHGWGSVEKTKKFVESVAKSGDYDYVLYGHTHQRDLRKFGNVLLINPGEACGYLTGKVTIALLDMDTQEVNFLYL
ncbi:YfcE family phosphodiesterase [Euryarchaeota archaeon ex4484_178]|nr:MAG: YfcE family phosphodiesterase [Euryarchaeota archaeon ex4484_178]